MSSRPYLVGYGKPPIETRFKKGASGNPKGRPPKEAKAQPRQQSRGFAALDQVVIGEALRPITIRENDQPVTMPMIQAVMRSLGVAAVKGHHKSQLAIATMVREIQEREYQQHSELVQTMIEYKESWQAEFEACDRAGRPRPDPVPHPDDIAIDSKTMDVIHNGPFFDDEKARWDHMFTAKKDWQEEAAFLKGKLKRKSKHEKYYREDLEHAELMIKIVSCSFPDEKTRRKPGFNIHRWREQQPSYKKLQEYRSMSPQQRRKQKLVL